MITKEQQNKWLEIISLTLDINREMGGAYIFVNVYPHVDLLVLQFYRESWTSGAFSRNIHVDKYNKSEDWMISQLKRVLDCEILYEDFYKEL